MGFREEGEGLEGANHIKNQSKNIKNQEKSEFFRLEQHWKFGTDSKPL